VWTRSFEAMVHGPVCRERGARRLGLFRHGCVGHADAVFLFGERAVGRPLSFWLSGLAISLRRPRDLRNRRRGRSRINARCVGRSWPRSLRAGVSFEQTVARAGEADGGPIAGEFRQSAGQIQLGLHPRTALENAAARIGLLDFNVFVSTVALYYQSGGNLALMLDRLAATALSPTVTRAATWHRQSDWPAPRVEETRRCGPTQSRIGS